jgi:hypothetical protein
MNIQNVNQKTKGDYVRQTGTEEIISDPEEIRK